MDGKEIHEVLRRADEALTIQGSYRAPEQARILAARDIVRDAMNDPALSTIDPEAIRAEARAEALREVAVRVEKYFDGLPYYEGCYTNGLHAAILADEPKEREDTKTWSNYEIGMLAAMMTGDIEKDWDTLAIYLRDEPDRLRVEFKELFPLQHGNEGGWIIDFDFLMGIQSDFKDAEDYGKPSLETIEEILLVLMRRAEVECKLKETTSSDREGLIYKSDVDDRGEG